MSQPQSTSQATSQVTEVLGNLIPLLMVAELLRTGFGFAATELPLAAFYTWYCLWLGLGHLVLYATNSFPNIRRGRWVKGSITAMLGLCWPAWLALAKQGNLKTD